MKIKETPAPKFIVHLIRNLIWAFVLIAAGLYVGMLGYHHFERMSWLDSFLNAAMILSDMGPVAPLYTNGGKLFAGFYALFSGLTFVFIFGLVLSPMVHKIFRKIHLGG